MTFMKSPGKGRGQHPLDLRNADVGHAYMQMQQACMEGQHKGHTPEQIARRIDKLQPVGSDRRLQLAWAAAKKEIFADYELPCSSSSGKPKA